MLLSYAAEVHGCRLHVRALFQVADLRPEDKEKSVDRPIAMAFRKLDMQAFVVAVIFLGWKAEAKTILGRRVTEIRYLVDFSHKK